MTYVFRYRRRLFWRKKSVRGHRYDNNTDKMVLYYPDGSIEEIGRWSLYDTKLGLDWLTAVKKTMEQEAGQSIPVNGAV